MLLRSVFRLRETGGVVRFATYCVGGSVQEGNAARLRFGGRSCRTDLAGADRGLDFLQRR